MKPLCAFICLVLLLGCGAQDADHADEHSQDAAEAFERGPHNGRLLEYEDFALELAIFEAGVPPEYRVWLYEDGKPLPPSAAEVLVTLTRLDGEATEFRFQPEGEYLRGDGVVEEPHSFDVEVTAQRPGAAPVQWRFESYEGRTAIAAATAREMGVVTKRAGPATIRNEITLPGAVVADPTRVASIRARYPGVTREVLVQPGAEVRNGAVLAQIQSNESLQNYPLLAPLGGTIVEHRAQAGVPTTEAPLFTIVDTSTVWVELDVFQNDLPQVRAGQTVEVLDLQGEPIASGTISRMSPLALHGSQSVRARVVIDNESGVLRPGQFVTGRVTVAEADAPLAVARDAIQRFRDFEVVFERIGETYEVRMLELGRSDATHVEVLSGLEPGAEYVAENSYLIKADIEKAGASHDH